MKYIFLRRYKDYKIGQVAEIKNKEELEYLLATETINKIENSEDGNFENYEIGNVLSDDDKTTETDKDDDSSSDDDKTTGHENTEDSDSSKVGKGTKVKKDKK